VSLQGHKRLSGVLKYEREKKKPRGKEERKLHTNYSKKKSNCGKTISIGTKVVVVSKRRCRFKKGMGQLGGGREGAGERGRVLAHVIVEGGGRAAGSVGVRTLDARGGRSR